MLHADYTNLFSKDKNLNSHVNVKNAEYKTCQKWFS